MPTSVRLEVSERSPIGPLYKEQKLLCVAKAPLPHHLPSHLSPPPPNLCSWGCWWRREYYEFLVLKGIYQLK